MSRKGTSSAGRKSKGEEYPNDPLSKLIDLDPDFAEDLPEDVAGPPESNFMFPD